MDKAKEPSADTRDRFGDLQEAGMPYRTAGQ